MLWFVVILALMIPLIAVVLDSQLGRALAGKVDARHDLFPDGLMDRKVAALEAEIERLGREVERLDDETAFLRKLLGDKPTTRAELPPGEQTS